MKQHKKLNSRGFSHHLILPILAIFAVGAIGVVTLNLSNASALRKNCAPNTTFGRYRNNPSYAKYDNYKSCVKAIQKKVGITGTGVDGIYGNNTQAKVKTWQAKYNKTHTKKLTVDGVVGPNTWKAMRIKPTYPTATARSCKAKGSNYVYKSGTCTKKAKAPKSTSSSKTTTDKYAAARKDCQAEKGYWNSKTNKCTYPTKFNYCDWVEKGVNSKLVCRTTNVAKGSPTYNSLWRRNDNAWNACRAYFKQAHIKADPNPSAATLNRYCQDVVTKP